MSVMGRLQELAGEEHAPVERFGEGQVTADSQDMIDLEEMLQATPIPGQSLTQDPENRLPYEQPAKYDDIQEFIDETFIRLTEPDVLSGILDVLRSNVPVEHVAEKYLMRAFQEGEINPDMLMLSIEPTIYMLISLATYGGVDPVLYPEDPMDEEPVDQRQEANYYKIAAQGMLKEDEDTEETKGVTIDDLQAPTVQPRSLLARSKQAVQNIQEG